MEKMKKNVSPVLIILFVILISFMIIAVYKNIKYEPTYSDNNDTSMENVYEATTVSTYLLFGSYVISGLEDVGNNIENCWYNHIYEDMYSSIEDAVSAGLDSSEETLSKVNGYFDTVKELYERILSYEIDSTRFKKIQSLSEEFYDAILEYYSLITNPRGNYITFTEEFRQAHSKALTAHDKLDIYLKQ